jgi:hypothetical protein
MARSKKMQTRTRKVRKHQKKQGKQTRHRGGRMLPRNEAKNEANRKAIMEGTTVNVIGVPQQNQGTVFNNGNNNNYINGNNNNYNNYNNTHLNNDPNVLRNEELLGNVYLALNTSFDDEEERTKMREALDGYFYALFNTAPKKAPGNTLESLTASFIHEAQKYLEYSFDKENLPFKFVMEDLFKAYEHFKELAPGPVRIDFIKRQEALNEESITPL